MIGVSAVGPSTTKADYSNYGLGGDVEMSAPGGWFRDGFGTPTFQTPGNLILSSYPLARRDRGGAGQSRRHADRRLLGQTATAAAAAASTRTCRARRWPRRTSPVWRRWSIEAHGQGERTPRLLARSGRRSRDHRGHGDRPRVPGRRGGELHRRGSARRVQRGVRGHDRRQRPVRRGHRQRRRRGRVDALTPPDHVLSVGSGPIRPASADRTSGQLR